MKKRVNIMLSEEAIDKADKSGNRSQYIEDLIMGTTPTKSEEKGLTEGRVLYLIQQELQKIVLPKKEPEWRDVTQGPTYVKGDW